MKFQNATTSQCSGSGSGSVAEITTEERQEKRESLSRKMMSIVAWDTDSPKSSLLDSFATSAVGTPETPLVATVRRCLKYSPETPVAAGVSRGSIQIEGSVVDDQIHVKSESDR